MVAHSLVLLFFVNNKDTLKWLGNVFTLPVEDLEDFIGVVESFDFALLNDFLLLVPVPFVDLTCFQSSSLGEVLHEWSGPVAFLIVFVLENLNLLLVFSSFVFLF